MKYRSLTILAGLLLAMHAQAAAYPRSPAIPAGVRTSCSQVIDKHYFRICYDYGLRAARAVVYVLDGRLVNARNIRRRPRFYPEPAVPRPYRAYPSDYTRNPYHMDRGHLAPDADFDWSMRSLKATYSMANIVPQYYLVNRKTWSKAERYERYVATRLGRVSVANIVLYPAHPSRWVGGRVAVPDAFLKVIWNDEAGFRRCFLYRNARISRREAQVDRLRDHEVSCDRGIAARAMGWRR